MKLHTYNYIQFWLDKHNNLTLNSDKTTCTLITPDPAEYKKNLELKINNTTLLMVTYPKVLGLPYTQNSHTSRNIRNISVHAHTSDRKVWGK